MKEPWKAQILCKYIWLDFFLNLCLKWITMRHNSPSLKEKSSCLILYRLNPWSFISTDRPSLANQIVAFHGQFSPTDTIPAQVSMINLFPQWRRNTVSPASVWTFYILESCKSSWCNRFRGRWLAYSLFTFSPIISHHPPKERSEKEIVA